MRGERTQGGYVPYQLNDFVFSVAGEELGFVGATGLLLLLAFVVGRVLVVAARAEEPFGRLVAVGVATWLAVQVVQNVGMNLGLLPVTGLPLPFVSYGGSSMLVSWLAVGLVDATHTVATRR
jgi:rod shape determining protein RodA